MKCGVLWCSESRVPIVDTDIIKLQEAFQLAGLKRIGSETMLDAIKLHSRENSFHPVREYLIEIEWDGKQRLKSWLSTYLGAEVSDYTAGVGQMFLISMVARVMEPGVKV